MHLQVETWLSAPYQHSFLNFQYKSNLVREVAVHSHTGPCHLPSMP